MISSRQQIGIRFLYSLLFIFISRFQNLRLIKKCIHHEKRLDKGAHTRVAFGDQSREENSFLGRLFNGDKTSYPLSSSCSVAHFPMAGGAYQAPSYVTRTAHWQHLIRIGHVTDAILNVLAKTTWTNYFKALQSNGFSWLSLCRRWLDLVLHYFPRLTITLVIDDMLTPRTSKKLLRQPYITIMLTDPTGRLSSWANYGWL